MSRWVHQNGYSRNSGHGSRFVHGNWHKRG
jgi:hypothetical protein